MNLTPVPSESATCANCSAPLVSDQRYCLACGHPVSPVRLAFLDVLQSEHQPHGGAPVSSAPITYAPLIEPSSTPAWLRRYSPLFGVLSVLLMAMIVGLLVGHWVTQNKATTTGPQVVKVEGLGASALAPAAGAAAPTATTPAATPSASKPSAKTEAAEVSKEAKAEKSQAAKVEHAKVVKPSTTTLKKLGSSTGKRHEEEVNALGAQPIETGG